MGDNTEIFEIPDIISHWPVKYRVNEHHDRVASLSNEWFAQYGVYQNNPTKRSFFFKCNLPLLTSMLYSDGEEERLRNTMDFITWIFSFDDSVDEDLRGNPDTTKIASEIVLGILKNPFGYKTSYKLGLSLQDFWQRVVTAASPGMQSRFVNDMAVYLVSCFTQNDNFSKNRYLSVKEYIVHRRSTSAVRTALDFLEYTLGLDELPDAFHAHPHVEKIKDGVNDVFSWANDIASFNMEQARGDHDNLVIVAMHEHGYTVQQAMDFAGGMVEARMDELLADCRFFSDPQTNSETESPTGIVISFGREADAQAREYVRGLKLWVAGAINWNLITERYFLTKNEEVRRTRRVELLRPGEDIVKGTGGSGEGIASVA